tara:strand:- start:273 stop:527 length:255 start_codon:yes stop_codon:yes gene_type:complete
MYYMSIAKSIKIDYACIMAEKHNKNRGPSFKEGPKKMVVTVRTDTELVKRARQYGVNISKTLHEALEDHIIGLDILKEKKGKAA